jgi:hypothetical protein
MDPQFLTVSVSKHHALKTYKVHEGEAPPILNPFDEYYFFSIFQKYAIII